MPRVKSSVVKRKRHKKVLKLAKGYYGKRSRSFRIANEAVMKALNSPESIDRKKASSADCAN